MDIFDMNIYQDGSDAIIKQNNFYGQNHKAAPGMGDEALIFSVKGLVCRDSKLAEYRVQQAEATQERADSTSCSGVRLRLCG